MTSFYEIDSFFPVELRVFEIRELCQTRNAFSSELTVHAIEPSSDMLRADMRFFGPCG